MARLQVEWREDAATLKRMYRQEKDHQRRTRLLAFWHLRQGRTIREAAEAVGGHSRTVQKWVAWYRRGGIGEVLRRRHGGRRPRRVRLTAEQLAELKALAEAGEIRTIWDGARWAKEKWGGRVHLLGDAVGVCTPGTAEEGPATATSSGLGSRAGGLEKRGLRRRLEEAGCRTGQGVFWSDEMRVGLKGQVRRVWAPRGVKVRQKQQFRREWRYLYVAVHGVEGKILWAWGQDMKAVSIAGALRQWHAQGVKVVVWDRARGHRGKVYAEVPVIRIEQPPYSPELNPAERVFEVLRAEVEGKTYATLADKCAAVEAVLQRLAADPERVRRLAG